MKKLIENKIQDLKVLLTNHEQRIQELIARNPHELIIEYQNKIKELKELLPILKSNKNQGVQEFEKEVLEDIKRLDYDVRVLKSHIMTDEDEIQIRKQNIDFLKQDILAFEELNAKL